MAVVYTELLSGNIKKEPGDGSQSIIPNVPGNAQYDAYVAWKDAGGTPQYEQPPSNEELRAALHAENYRMAQAKFAGLTSDYHPTETIEWQKLESECRVYQADQIPANIGACMQAEIDATEAMGGTLTALELTNRVIPKADSLRQARHLILGKRHANRKEIDALPDYNALISYNLQYDGLGF